MTRPAPTVTVPPQALEAIAFNLCSLHDFDPAFVQQNERFAMAAITEYLRATPAPAAPQAAGVGEIADAVAFMDAAAVMLGRGEMPAPGSDYAAKWYLAHATLLSALRAPSREPEGGAVADYSVRTEGAPGITEPDPALATREEAPAEAGEFVGAGDADKARGVYGPLSKDFLISLLADRDAEISSLRAQPQAREDAQPVSCPRCNRGEVFGLSMDDGFWVEFVSAAGGANSAGMHGWLELHEHHPDGRVVMREYVAKDSPIYPAPDALRVAVEALTGVREKLSDKSVMPVQRVSWASSAIDQALAALQAEQGAK